MKDGWTAKGLWMLAALVTYMVTVLAAAVAWGVMWGYLLLIAPQLLYLAYFIVAIRL
jgi:hypothetical protein